MLICSLKCQFMNTVDNNSALILALVEQCCLRDTLQYKTEDRFAIDANLGVIQVRTIVQETNTIIRAQTK